MQPYDLIRRAAKLIETQGWTQGAAARDQAGAEVQLLAVGQAGDSRVRVNNRAHSFSIYGALVKAQELYGEPTNVGVMWNTLMELAAQLDTKPAGGKNFVHPVITYNENMDRTLADVLAFMEQAATAIEAKLNPPAEVAS
jgi:hypothetical protein